MPRPRLFAALPLLTLLAWPLSTGGVAGAATVAHRNASVAAVPASAPAAATPASSGSCTVTDGHVGPNPVRPHRPPPGTSYFGGFALGDGASNSDAEGSFKAYEQKACRPMDIAHVYVSSKKKFPPDRFTTKAAKQGKTILLSWTGDDVAAMADGSDNARIVEMAKEIKAFPYPVLFEFRWEMDIPHNANQVHSPADYIRAWHRTYRIFQRQQVQNASWVWCPSDIGFAKGWAQQYYPGDSEVDWLCTDAYIDYRFAPESTYQSPSMELSNLLAFRKQHPKPIIIGEFGVPRTTWPTAWRVKWFTRMLSYVKRHHVIRAACYFDHKPAGAPESHDVTLGTNPQVIAAFRKLAADPLFRPSTRADPNP